MGLHSQRLKIDSPSTKRHQAMRLADRDEEVAHAVHDSNASRTTITRSIDRFRAAATFARVSIRSLLLEGR
ncbi:MAG TPA: hypothetical protein VD704_04340 [Gaiellaceae bacterium]|nr:hypothetical protein [Gaiellaceae bacterium]